MFLIHRRYCNSIKPRLDDFHNKIKKPDTHPFIDTSIVDDFIKTSENFSKDFQSFNDNVKGQFDNRKKEDWVHIESRSSEDRIISPRHELLKEIHDYAQVQFWMYTFSQFLYKAKKLLDTRIDDKVLEEVDRVNQEEVERVSQQEFQSLYFEVVSEEQVIYELQRSLMLISDNPDAFVGLKLFVVEVLGKKGFEINHSYAIINDMDSRGMVRIYDILARDRTIKAITLPIKAS